MAHRIAASAFGFLGIALLGSGLGYWIHPGAGAAAAGVVLIVLVVRSSSE